MHEFSHQLAVITGAGSGIGQALAVSLARQGCDLALADLNTDGLEKTRAMLEGTSVKVSVHRLDVASRQALEQFADEVMEFHGKVSLLFNNAGVALASSAEATREEDFHWLMDINFWGVVNGCQVFLPHLRKQPRAHIINISSVFGLIAMPTQSAYNASKFAVRGYSEALQQELANTSVGLSVVCPGGVRTAIVANARVDQASALALGGGESFSRRFEKLARTTPEQAADIILDGVRKGQQRILVGRDAHVIHWITRLFPRSYARLLARVMPIPGINVPARTR
ncbi:MAG: SDR family NAD(P)-dependent oxidoreductase [Chromatiales bacterium]|nr:SDR family NAD(P)-dependent oxidoreductase [Chromatiales bacterium]